MASTYLPASITPKWMSLSVDKAEQLAADYYGSALRITLRIPYGAAERALVLSASWLSLDPYALARWWNTSNIMVGGSFCDVGEDRWHDRWTGAVKAHNLHRRPVYPRTFRHVALGAPEADVTINTQRMDTAPVLASPLCPSPILG